MNRSRRFQWIALLMMALLWSPVVSYALEVGDSAPLFEGNSTQGNITLTDFQGDKNVVLALYFAAFTPV